MERGRIGAAKEGGIVCVCMHGGGGVGGGGSETDSRRYGCVVFEHGTAAARLHEQQTSGNPRAGAK